jgi:hypothetical protein
MLESKSFWMLLADQDTYALPIHRGATPVFSPKRLLHSHPNTRAPDADEKLEANHPVSPKVAHPLCSSPIVPCMPQEYRYSERE